MPPLNLPLEDMSANNINTNGKAAKNIHRIKVVLINNMLCNPKQINKINHPLVNKNLPKSAYKNG